MGELKPCPFCGNVPEISKRLGRFAVVCTEIDCECAFTEWRENKESAIKQWNNRPEEEALTEHLRLKEEECKQLQQDKAELVSMLEVMSSFYGCSLKDDGINPETCQNYAEARELLEKHK